MKFNELNLIEPILKAVEDKGYSEPTPIQEQAIPLVLNRKDLLGCAQTGTGKTAAFSIPIIQLIQQKEGNKLGKPALRALIVTPTRELAIQIDENIKAYAKETGVKNTVIFGGVKQGKQVDRLKKGVHILVATPGRLLDLIGQGFISLDDIKLFVLDEADRMLDMGFINDIKKIIKLLPQLRQSLFFSATMPDNIVDLSRQILRNPVKVEVTPASSTAETVQQYLYYTNRTDKRKLLIHILEERQIDQGLVFSRTKHGADRIVRDLRKNKIKALAIHGDKAQNQRQKSLDQFKDGNIRVLVATDIAARGIDINKLRFVINYDIPNLPETYVHRIGRSGRAGEEGIAISICEPEENVYIRSIQKLIGDQIEVVDVNPYPQTEKPMTEAEKKEWNKEKQRRKQEYFANRKKAKEKKQSSPKKAVSQKNKDKSAEKRLGNDQKHGNRKKRNNKRPKNKQQESKTKKSGGRYTKDLPESLRAKFMFPLE
jgi:ATP-dependent RNA helicase RhlE